MDIDLKNQINLFDPLWVFLLALMTNGFSEFLSWMFIYRTKKYQNTKKQIDILTKKIEESKEMHKSKDKNFEKKTKMQENELKSLNSEMMKVIIIIGNETKIKTNFKVFDYIFSNNFQNKILFLDNIPTLLFKF